jgi:glycosyltransferase involved in cell wall biosynthesis
VAGQIPATPGADAIALAADGAAGVLVILSANPIHDTGGGQRSAQIALEFLARDFAVVFVSHGRVTETVDLDLRYDHARLVQLDLSQALEPQFRASIGSVLAGPSTILLTQLPVNSWLPMIEAGRMAGAVTVYDCIDRWDSELGRGWYRAENESRVAGASMHLIASAYELVDHLERLTGREVKLIPNAFNARLFGAPTGVADDLSDFPEADRVVIYVGALWGGWLDWRLVRKAADAHLDTAFVFVGDHRGEGRGLPSNCHFLGLKPQTDLPPYLRRADLAFLPWKVDDVTRATSPLKIYEFVAMGLPVVGPEIEPLREIPGVRLCRDADAFVAAIGSEGRSSLADGVRDEMRTFAKHNSWGERVDRLLGLTADGYARAGRPAVDSRAATHRRHFATGSTLSVVIPSYNHERWIGAAVDSVRSQTLPASELVVVDDGSSDDSLAVLADHRFPGMRVVRQRNRGAHLALNRAIALSKGDYLAILNSDDIFDPPRLEHAWGVARATGAALVCGSVRLIDAEGGEVDPEHDIARWYREARDLARSAPSLRQALRRHNVAVTTSNFFMHRELWSRLGGFAAYRYVHDYDFLLRAVRLCPDRVVYEDSLRDVGYRVHGANTISESHERALEERREMLLGVRREGRRLVSVVRRPADRSAVRAAVDGSAVLTPIARPVAPAEAVDRAIRVGIVVRSLGNGGLEEILALLAQALPAAGVDTCVLCSHAGGAVADRLRSAGVGMRIASGRAAEWLDWAKGEGLDLISSHFAPHEVIATLAPSAIPVVETIHNTYAWFLADDWEREQQRIDRVAAVVAVSDGAAAYYERHSGHRPHRVIPNAIHPGRVPRVPRVFARGRYGLGPDDVVLCSIGRITEQKNPAGLLRAFEAAAARAPELRLLLAGSPDRSGRMSSLTSTHRALFSRGVVRHIGAVEDVGTVLSASDAFVSNSFYEGWSVAASEAAWVGLPLLLSETGGSAELIGRDSTRGVLVPNPCGAPLDVTKEVIGGPDPVAVTANEAVLSDALVRFVAERDAWHARGPMIRAHARRTLEPTIMAERYARCFRDVLAGLEA